MRTLFIIALLAVSGLAQAAPETPKKKPTPMTNDERKQLVLAADDAKNIQLELEQQRLEKALALVAAEATAKAAQLKLQAAQISAERATTGLQTKLSSANEKVQALLNDTKKKHDAEGCEPAGVDWKCPDPTKTEAKPSMCGDKPCSAINK